MSTLLTPPKKRLAALAAAGVGLWFVVIYNIANHLATLSSARIAPHFAWEISIPVYPWMIAPYWSIDLLFLVSFFLCRTPGELRAHAMRLLFGIAVAGACFILWPLTLAWPRVTDAGLFQPLFDALYSFDKPHNLAPSLHIVILLMLWPVYHRGTILKWLVAIWMTLILVSVFFTHQHHIIDVVTALPLAAICWYFFPNPFPKPARIAPRWKIAWRYWNGAIACLLLAAALGYKHHWRLLYPLWPAFALFILGLGYAGAGPRIFRKSGGTLPWSTLITLGPILLFTRLFHRWLRKGSPAWNKIGDRILLGRLPSAAEASKLLSEERVIAILDMTSEYSESPLLRARNYRNIPLLDYSEPSPAQFEEAAAFIAEHSQHGTVYIHCAMGFSRSAAIVAAVLVLTNHSSTAAEAVAHLRQQRPRVHIWPALESAIAKARQGDFPPKVV